METVIRAVRKHRKDGLRETLSEGIDIIYRRKLLRSALRYSFDNFDVLTQEELVNRATRQDRYYLLSGSNGKLVPRKKDVPSNTLLEEAESTQFRQPFVTILDDTTVIGPSGIGRTLNGKLIADTVARSTHPQGRLTDGLSRSMASFGPVKTWRELKEPGYVEPAMELESACPLIQIWGVNYYHWMGETLPKLRGVERIQEEYGLNPTLLVPSEPTSWMLESLELFGYKKSDIVSLSDLVVDIKQLVVPSYPGPHASELEWLRDEIVSEALAVTERPDVSNRLLLSRENATRRRMTNIDTVERVLQDRGFEKIDPGNYSVPEQALIFKEAETIVGAHGAGLTNMVFADDANIVELFGERKRTTFYRMAELLDFRYEYTQNRSNGIDIHVDIPTLIKTLPNL